MASSPVLIQVATPGPPGPTGPTGAPGAAGYSPQYIVASGAPSSGVGLKGDMYINSSTSDVWGPKIDNTTWPATPACNIRGTQGTPGYTPQYIVAAGAPSNSLGNNGDMYINSTTSDVYGPKASGAWGGIVCNIKGATGSTGAQGPPGVAYTPMGAWNSTTAYAQGHEVTDGGILYISLQNGNLNKVPASNPTYWQAVATGGQQTPWQSDIDAANHALFKVGSVSIGGPSFGFAPLNVRASTDHNIQIGGMGWAVADAMGFNCVNDANNATIPFAVNASKIYLSPNVGIGLVNPPVRLAVQIPVSNPNLSADCGGFYLACDSTVGLAFGAFTGTPSYNLWIQTKRTSNNGVAESLCLNPIGGFVGIGTGTPGYLFTASQNGGGAQSIVAQFTDPNTSNGIGPISAFVTLANHFVVNPGVVITGVNSIALAVGDGSDADAQRKLIVLANGYCGIGTINPQAKLDCIGGTIRISNDCVGGGGASQLAITGQTDNRKSMWLAFDTTANVGMIDAGVSGASWNPIILNHAGGNVGVNSPNPQVSLDCGGTVRAMGSQAAGAGSGLEMSYDGATGYIQCLSRPTPGWKPLGLNAQSFQFGLGMVTGGLGINVNPLTKLQCSDGANHSIMLVPGATNTIQSMNDAATAWQALAINAPGGLYLNPGTGSEPVGIGTPNPQAHLHQNTLGLPTSSGSLIAGHWITCNDGNQDTLKTAIVRKSTGSDWGSAAWRIDREVDGTHISGIEFGSFQVVVRTNGVVRATFDNSGNCNITGQYQVNGVPISTGGGGVTTQNIVTGSRAFNVYYTNSTGKPMFVTVNVTLTQNTTQMQIFTSPTQDNTGLIFTQYNSGTVAQYATAAFWVLPGNSYKVSCTANVNLVAWTEWT